jgi:hypothetical protein
MPKNVDASLDLTATAKLVPNYGERYRYGETIATAIVESMMNQVVSQRFVKKTTDEIVAPRSTRPCYKSADEVTREF